MTSFPLLIEESNVSCAWAKIVLYIVRNPGKEISPLIISLSDFSEDGIVEDRNFRDILDGVLAESGNQSIDTVANTIFPEALWTRCRHNRQDLFNRYINHFLPRAKALEACKNSRGLYFQGKRKNQ